jgi:hypothetical protein
MRFFSYLILLLAAFFLLRNFLGEKEKRESLKDLLAPGNSEAQALSESFERVLPSMKNKGNPNLVRVKSRRQRLDVIDVLDRLDALRDNKEQEGLLYARSVLLSREYDASEKEEVFEQAAETLSPQEMGLLSRDLLFLGNETALYPIALEVHTKSMRKADIEKFLKEILRERKEELLREAVLDFARSHEVQIGE